MREKNMPAGQKYFVKEKENFYSEEEKKKFLAKPELLKFKRKHLFLNLI